MNNTSILGNDNQIYLINLVNFLNKTISQYGLGLIWLIGNIGSSLTCLVFYQPTFRKSPCAMFFLASNFAQFFAFNFALFTRMLQYGYGVKTINISLWFCKIRYYLFYIFIANSRYNIIMASIDRYFASSRNALRRQWSSPKVALRVIIGSAIFWCIMYIQVLIFYDIKNTSCQYQSGAYGTFFSIYISIDSGILPISLMLIFGLLTVKNVHETTRRIGPVTGNNDGQSVQTGKISKKDAQLHKMLANQIVLFVILNLPNPCFLVYQSYTINISKSPLRSTVETFVNNMTYVLLYFGFSMTFANFSISSEMFRREFIRVIQTKILHRYLPPVQTNGGTTVRIRQVTDVPD